MPPKPKPKPKTTVRRVRAVALDYKLRRPERGGGGIVEVLTGAFRGDEIVLSPQEEARLDSLGALAPPGASKADVEREIEATVEAFRAARRDVSVNA